MKYIEYVEAQANYQQYLNTEVLANNVSKIEIDFAKTQTPVDWSCIIGACEQITSGDYSIQCTWHNNTFMAYTGLVGISSNITDNDYHKHVIEIESGTFKYTVDGVQQGSANRGNTGAYALWLFRCHHNISSSYQRPMPAKLRSCKIWDINGDLIRDYVPVLNNSNVAGLYDNVNNTFNPSSGSVPFVAGPEIAGNYTIQYNANGGSGSMEDQTVNVDEYDFLRANTFTKAGYEFSGWATSSGGPVVYLDGQQIYNIAEEDETITLYAVWVRLTLRATLYTNNSPKNMVTKDLTQLANTGITFKDATDIIDPVFIFSGVSGDIIAATNYIYVAMLGRYYFVNKIESIRTDVWALYCHVDVLSSYADAIREQYAIIKRQEEKYNKYINDGVFKTYQYSNIETFPFTSGFTTLQYILMVAGN